MERTEEEAKVFLIPMNSWQKWPNPNERLPLLLPDAVQEDKNKQTNKIESDRQSPNFMSTIIDLASQCLVLYFRTGDSFKAKENIFLVLLMPFTGNREI